MIWNGPSVAPVWRFRFGSAGGGVSAPGKGESDSAIPPAAESTLNFGQPSEAGLPPTTRVGGAFGIVPSPRPSPRMELTRQNIRKLAASGARGPGPDESVS